MTRIVPWTPGLDPLGRTVAAIGVFDGVHIGHQELVRDTVSLARDMGASSAIVTFDRDPDQVVTPSTAAPQLLSLDDKIELLSQLGADTLIVMPFTPELARTPPLTFLDEVLLGSFEPVGVVVGYDFRFGHRAEGDVDVLVRYGAREGFSVVAHTLVGDGEGPVTSTRIRGLIADGDVASAARLLGRPHRVAGEVGHGRGVGATLDAPTANLLVSPAIAVPAPGVYAGTTRIGQRVHAAAVFTGTPPAFPEGGEVFEVHVLDYDDDLYGIELTVELLDRVRDIQRFDTETDLTRAISEDLVQVRAIVALEGTKLD